MIGHARKRVGDITLGELMLVNNTKVSVIICVVKTYYLSVVSYLVDGIVYTRTFENDSILYTIR